MTTTQRTEKASAEENPLKLSLQEDIEDVLADQIESRNMQRKSEGRGRKLRWNWSFDPEYFPDPKAMVDEPDFRELLIRWFQFGVFSPVCRLHGHRRPSKVLPAIEDSGLFDFTTCGPNEAWSYGEDHYKIIKSLLFLRERLRPYVERLMEEASQTGAPVLRTLFYNYPKEEACWGIEDQLMMGRDILAAPILYAGMTEQEVYLPGDDIWIDYYTGTEYRGGQTLPG